MSAFGDRRRNAAKGSNGDAEGSGGALNVRSFQLPKTCSFRLPLTNGSPSGASFGGGAMERYGALDEVLLLGEEIPLCAGDLVGDDGGDHGVVGGSVRWCDGGIDWCGEQSVGTRLGTDSPRVVFYNNRCRHGSLGTKTPAESPRWRR